ncbi:UPF0104 family protein [Pontibacillus yanchengensis]|uniref:UPF0104 family protein n=2 Tax=Pontibacillus yanchengensis TaxID=462910 RepID=A0ACC7VEA7_9BACI|nr:lysylphosphatidylglycerol synthase transmembrane domain-containing protein [Pontibacillus yanchengensis]MYL34745.1 UPF0104 family protein [Pontibacillus yanchengensis]MYL52269.1 UPF0104 family protein [Pontibacillus yanchengensis]
MDRIMERLKRYVEWSGRIFTGLLFIWLTYVAFDLSYILEEVEHLFDDIGLVMMMTCSYFVAFLLRAKAWQLYIGKQVGYKRFVDGMLYSLFFNHLLPFKAGDIIRTSYLAQSKLVNWKKAVESVVVMRLLDLIILGSIAVIGVVYIGVSLSFVFLIALLLGTASIIGVLLLKDTWRQILFYYIRNVFSVISSTNGLILFIIVFLSWCLEAVVVLAVSTQFELSITYLNALWVNSFTIAGQVFHFSPGGIGTYESFMSFALRAFQVPVKDAYTIAIITHGYKFIFSFIVGIYLIVNVPISWNTMKDWLRRKED